MGGSVTHVANRLLSLNHLTPRIVARAVTARKLLIAWVFQLSPKGGGCGECLQVLANDGGGVLENLISIMRETVTISLPQGRSP